MSFGLARGRELDPNPIGITEAELGPLPDSITTDPASARMDIRRWFARPEAPLEIEIGCGKGTFLIQQALLDQSTNYLGIEWAREFWLYTSDRCRRQGLTNVRTLNTDASEFVHWRMQDESVRVIHLYFSDPWPKTRHHRRRVVQDRFLQDCHRVLTQGGELRIVTDHEEYWEWMEKHFARVTGTLFAHEEFARADSAEEGEIVGTNFERKYRREGRPFRACVLRKLSSGARVLQTS